MVDEQHLDLIDTAFSSFRDDGPLPTPLGTAAVRTTVRHRQRVRVMTAGALAALAVAAPITAYATGRLDSNGPPAVPGASFSSSAAPTTSTPTSTAPTAAAPDGRISQSALGNATLDLPRWTTRNPSDANSCGGKAKFSNGKARDGVMTITKVINVDVDNDGAQETIALINCKSGEIGEMAVIGFDRDTSGATVVMGLAVSSDIGGSSMDMPEEIADIRPAGNTVEAKLGDVKICCYTYEVPATEYHWRGYSYNGTAFTQVSGPTKMPQNSHLTNLALKVDSFTIKAGTPYTTATLNVTIRNAGPTAQVPVFWAQLPERMKLKTQTAGCKDTADPGFIQCDFAKLQVGKEVTLKVELIAPSTTFPAGTTGELDLQVHTKVTDKEANPLAYYGNLNADGNEAKVTYTVAA